MLGFEVGWEGLGCTLCGLGSSSKLDCVGLGFGVGLVELALEVGLERLAFGVGF